MVARRRCTTLLAAVAALLLLRAPAPAAASRATEADDADLSVERGSRAARQAEREAAHRGQARQDAKGKRTHQAAVFAAHAMGEAGSGHTYRLLKLRDGYLKPRPPADDGSYTSLVMALAVDGESERSVVVSAEIFEDDDTQKMHLAAVHVGGDDAHGQPVDPALGASLDRHWTAWNREQRALRASSRAAGRGARAGADGAL